MIRTFFDITVGICNIDTFKFIRIFTSTLELRIETVCQEFSICAKELRVDNSCVETSFRGIIIRIVATVVTVAINFKPTCLEGTITSCVVDCFREVTIMVSGCIMIKGVAKNSTGVFAGEVVFITYGEESTSDLLALIVKVVEVLVNSL